MCIESSLIGFALFVGAISAGRGCDLVIEQTLMRSVKSTGGLTRGAQLQQRHLGNKTLPTNASTKIQYNPPLSTFLPCQTNLDHSATAGWSLRSEQVQIYPSPLLSRV